FTCISSKDSCISSTFFSLSLRRSLSSVSEIPNWDLRRETKRLILTMEMDTLGDRILPQPSSEPSAVPSFLRTPGGRDVLELLGDFLQGAVDVKLWTFAEGLLANGTEINTVAPSSSVPVGRDAPLTEAMSTWSRDGVLEDLETDGTRELILTQKCSSQRHY
uniref:Uncharacterized protein n=1 Tax=Takifugu rubripes TaxID=31033 RepID=A0A674MLK0_TAKRU